MILVSACEPVLHNGNTHGHYILEFAKQNEVVYTLPPNGFSIFNIWKSIFQSPVKAQENIYTFQYYSILPNRSKFTKWINDVWNARILDTWAYKRNTKFDLHIAFHPLIWAYMQPESKHKVYFPVDGYGKYTEDKLWASIAKTRITVNSVIMERYAHEFKLGFHLFPHGIPDLPKDFQAKEVTDFIFVGTLNPGIDGNLLMDIATKFPDKSLTIVGPIQSDTFDYSRLIDLPNVRYVGPKSYPEIHAYIASADICLVPYRIESENVWRNPIKITDYLAHGKCILNTVNHPDLQGLEEIGLYNVSSREAWNSQALVLSKKQNSINTKALLKYQNQNAYSQLVKQIQALLPQQAEFKSK